MPRKKKRNFNPYTPLVSPASGLSTTDGRELSPNSVLDNFPCGSSLEVDASNTLEACDQTQENVTDEDEDVSALLSNLSLVGDESGDGSLPPAVLYFGWLFKSDVCAALKEISVAYIQQCYFGVSQFERFLTTSSEKRGVRDHMDFYQYPARSRKTRELPDYHVTAKYCGREKLPTQEYGKEFGHLLGTGSNVHIIGLFFTEKTFGFRVKLTPQQIPLFDEKDASTKCRSKSSAQTIPSKSHCDDKISRAHITIGCAPNVKAYQAGEDLKDLIDLETRVQSVFTADYTLENGDVLRQFGRFGDAFIVYLSKQFIVNAEFNFKT
ncbi:unnamed protein product [Allacma fusca]|uniref:Cyclic nucleotide phosphodiesterase catalytic domain-containing protein n=1 Tax=Allacma fusca TaxID=39272 RepID=A0A8J2KAQ3_9HEXA|nr:unnamed protein product [Allacma fusca]